MKQTGARALRARMVLDARRGAPGGAERVADGIERVLVDAGWDVEWVSGPDLTNVYRSSRYPGLNAAFRSLAMARVLRHLPRVELTISHGMLGMGARRPQIHVYHGTFVGLALACRGGLARLDRLVMCWANGLMEATGGVRTARVAVSRQVAEEVRRYYRLGRTRVIHNAVDSQHLAAGGDRRALRASFGLPAEGFLAVTVGRMDYGKGRDVLAKIISDTPPETRFVIASPASAHSERLPADRVHWLGTVPYERLPQLYSACDAVLVPSLYEGFGLTILEGWACGLPTVTHRVGVVPELEGHCDDFDSCVAQVGDYAGMAAALARLTSDPDLARRQTRWAGQLISQRFSFGHLRAAYQSLIEEVLDGADTWGRTGVGPCADTRGESQANGQGSLVER